MTNARNRNTSGVRLKDLLHPHVLAAFDRTTFEREGYWVWEGILTDAGRRQWVASLQNLQAMNDSIVAGTDWLQVDFTGRGLTAPDPAKVTPEALNGYLGGSEQMQFQTPGQRDYMYSHGLFDESLATQALTTQGIEWQGMMPEYFPLAYDAFILDIATSHPQMMELFGKVLGERFLIDHVLMLNRIPGSRGRRWHGHPYRQGQHETEDPAQGGQVASLGFLPHQCVRTLCFPAGMSEHDGGGEFSVVPGAHLYRTPYLWDTRRTEYDEQFEAGWMRDKNHPVTGEPLRIERLDLPPGSMVSFVHHMPHHAGHRALDAETRWGLLMAYRTPDPTESSARTSTLASSQASRRWNEGTPAHWAQRMEDAGRLTPAMCRVFEGETATT
jgi:hypothetical protein